jgi:hypothetical protein
MFNIDSLSDISSPARKVLIKPNEFSLLNPNTLNCPIFRTQEDAELTKKIYSHIPILDNIKQVVNHWGAKPKTMFNMTSDSHIFKEDFHDGHVPLYESKIFNNYDHRYTTYENATQANINSGILPRIEDESKKDPSFSLKPFYWLDKKDLISKTNSEEWKWNKNWFLAFRIITNSTSERTSVFSIIPRFGVGNSAAVMLTKIERTDIISCLLANFNSLAFDFIARQKIGGNNLNLFVVKQLPVLPPESYTPQDIEFISSRVLELVYTAWDMQPFAQDIWEESGIGSRESIIRQWEAGNGKSHNSILSGSAGLGRGNEIGTDVLSNHQNLPQGGDVRNDFTDPQSSSLSTSEHSRGLRAGESGRIHSISENSPRIAQGSRDSSDIVSQSEFDYRTDCGTSSQAMRNSGQNVAFSDSDNAEQEIKNRESVMGYGNWESGIEESNKNDSRLTTHDSRTNEEQIPIPPFSWNPERRALLRAELDAKYAKLYGLTRDELRYILDPSDVYGAEFPSETFRVLKNKEIKEYGEYRTQRLVLAAWDLMESGGQMPSEV